MMDVGAGGKEALKLTFLKLGEAYERSRKILQGMVLKSLSMPLSHRD